jgi:DNA polymerase-1
MSLYLVDGHALAYRSYYAFIRRPLVNSKGEETSAVFGFVKTMLNLLERFEPSHLAVVFDAGEVTFRSELYADYKANRPKMPESLAEQLPRIVEVLEAMSIKLLISPGYEADDIIATLSSRLERDTSVRIVSGDKDLFQVVSDSTHVLRPGKGGLLDDEIDPAFLKDKYNLAPPQFIDYQALRGDPTDNVPGVPGVGEKTALKLMQQFGSLEAVYERLDEVSSKSLREKLANAKEQAFLSRRLVQLDCDVPMDVTMVDMARSPFDVDRLRELLRSLEFDQIIDSLPQPPRVEQQEAEKRYELVDSEPALRDLVELLRSVKEFAIDTETSGLDPMQAVLAGVTVSEKEGVAWYVPVSSVLEEDDQPTLLLTPPREAPGLPPDTVASLLGPVLADEGIAKIGQNIKYDAVVLANAGMPLRGIRFDTMLASYCLNPARRSHGLDSLADEILGHRMIPFKSLFDTRAKKKDIRTVPLDRVTEYACEDSDYTLRLKHAFQPMLDASQVKPLFEDVEMPLSQVLTRMGITGVKLDTAVLDELSRELDGRLTGLQQSIFEETGEEFNINSTAKLQEILFGKLGLKPTHKTKTGYSTDTEVLKGLSEQHKVADLIIEYRMVSKLKGTYVDALPRLVNPKTGRVHTSYNQAVASTGRLSSSDPNLQNIPIRTPLGREIRKAFVASEEGWVMLDADYSQIELRIMAHLSRDAELIQAFADDADVHRRTAARMLGVSQDEVSDDMRSRAKTVNFGIMYGMGARGLAQSLDIDVKEAKQFIEDYFESYPGVRRFIDETIAQARQDRAVSTLLGRVRQLPDIDSGDRRAQAFAERTAVNTPIQGTAADIIKVAMVELDRELLRRGLVARMILQVHDELLLDVPASELAEVSEIVKETMEQAVSLDVPLKVDMASGHNWLEAHG